jgi:ATP-dependent RNA helicase HelY
MMAGALDNLSAGELAEVCSWFTFDNERRLNNRDQLNNPLMQVRRELWRIVQHVRGIEDRANITMSPGIVPDFHGIALAWARNMSLNGLLRRIDLAEGDLLMVLNQTIDLVQQVQSAIGQAVDARDIWEQFAPIMTDGVLNERNAAAHAREGSMQLETQRIRLTKLRPLLAQASHALLHGIILQSRTVPSMVARIGDEEIQLNPEEDTEPREI